MDNSLIEFYPKKGTNAFCLIHTSLPNKRIHITVFRIELANDENLSSFYSVAGSKVIYNESKNSSEFFQNEKIHSQRNIYVYTYINPGIYGFIYLGLKITAEGNQKIVHFLDVTFDLTTSKYDPYREPNDDPLYINSRSNHPPSILTQLPRSINNRLSRLSCDEATFKTISAPYQDALQRSNYDNILTYNEADPTTTNQRNRSRNIIWFNQPYTRNVKTNIGRKFLTLIDKHFTSNHALHKIFNPQYC